MLPFSVFPDIWKRQKLVLLPKNDKPSEDPSSYRPIFLIETFGKLFESIICARPQAYIETVNGLAETKLGFRRARSTTDAIAMVISTAAKAINAKSYNHDYCLIVTLGVKNAFNNANWLNIANALKALKTP